MGDAAFFVFGVQQKKKLAPTRGRCEFSLLAPKLTQARDQKFLAGLPKQEHKKEGHKMPEGSRYVYWFFQSLSRRQFRSMTGLLVDCIS